MWFLQPIRVLSDQVTQHSSSVYLLLSGTLDGNRVYAPVKMSKIAGMEEITNLFLGAVNMFAVLSHLQLLFLGLKTKRPLLR